MLKSIYILEGQVQGADHSSGSKAGYPVTDGFRAWTPTPCLFPHPLKFHAFN